VLVVYFSRGLSAAPGPDGHHDDRGEPAGHPTDQRPHRITDHQRGDNPSKGHEQSGADGGRVTEKAPHAGHHPVARDPSTAPSSLSPEHHPHPGRCRKILIERVVIRELVIAALRTGDDTVVDRLAPATRFRLLVIDETLAVEGVERAVVVGVGGCDEAGAG
jgi:hypothetical protein